jgi:hypothetical protein
MKMGVNAVFGNLVPTIRIILILVAMILRLGIIVEKGGDFMERIRKLVLAAFLMFLVGVGVYASLILTRRIATHGTLTNFTVSSTSIDWGNVTVGVPMNETVVLTNTGNKPLRVNMTYDKVVGLSNFSLIWNLEATIIESKGNATANFQLTIFNYTESSFSFDIIITGETT